MAANPMLPAHPPLPTASNFPFQPEAGIQTSISMCESVDGANTAATRQCAGRLAVAGRASAAVMGVLGSESDLSRSQGVCPRAANARERRTERRSITEIVFYPNATLESY